MSRRLVIPPGSRFGRLVVIRELESRSHCGSVLFKVRCDCGEEIIRSASSLNAKNSKSCGCLKRDVILKRNTKHGLRFHKLYHVWDNMIGRCYNNKSKYWYRYGGRGISVCKEWRDTPAEFLKWAEVLYFKDSQLDRINNDGDYSPDNCRFVTAEVNSNNHGKISTNTSGYTGIFYVDKKYRSCIHSKGKTVYLGLFPTIEEAVEVRNNYIRKNNLPHRLQTVE